MLSKRESTNGFVNFSSALFAHFLTPCAAAGYAGGKSCDSFCRSYQSAARTTPIGRHTARTSSFGCSFRATLHASAACTCARARPISVSEDSSHKRCVRFCCVPRTSRASLLMSSSCHVRLARAREQCDCGWWRAQRAARQVIRTMKRSPPRASSPPSRRRRSRLQRRRLRVGEHGVHDRGERPGAGGRLRVLLVGTQVSERRAHLPPPAAAGVSRIRAATRGPESQASSRLLRDAAVLLVLRESGHEQREAAGVGYPPLSGPNGASRAAASSEYPGEHAFAAPRRLFSVRSDRKALAPCCRGAPQQGW